MTAQEIEEFWAEKLERAIDHIKEHRSKYEGETSAWTEKLDKALEDVKDYRSKYEEAASARVRMEADLKEALARADERARHEDNSNGSMKAMVASHNSAIATLRDALAGERKAREAAEQRAAEARAYKITPEKKPHSWRIEVSRDRNGFIVAMEATPLLEMNG
jgi:broad specificity phosphatase PhoE